MTPEIREIAGLIALVSTALIGTTIYLLKLSWQGMENSYFKVAIVERQTVGRANFWFTLCTLIVLFVVTLVGVYYPDLAPWAAMLVIFLIEVIAVFISIGSWVFRKIKKVNKEQKTRKLDDMSLFYAVSLSYFLFSLLFNLFALLGVTTTMLDIRIGPYWLDNFKLGKWLLVDSIFLFIMGIPMLGYASFKLYWQRRMDADIEY
jgi:hypothetical protein